MVGASALGLLVLALVSPLNIPGWQYVGPRLAWLGVVLGVALVDVPLSPRARHIAIGAVTLLALGSTYVSTRLHRTLHGGCSDALSAIGQPLSGSGPQLSIVLDDACGAPSNPNASPVPLLAAPRHMGALYATAHGHLEVYLFMGSPAIHSVGPRDTWSELVPPVPSPTEWPALTGERMANDPAYRRAMLTRYAVDGSRFARIVIFGARPADRALFTDLGYEALWHEGSFYIGAFVGCPAVIAIPKLAAAPLLVEYGLAPLTTPLGRLSVTPSDGEAEVHLPIPERLCGDVWAAAIWDVDRSGSASAPDRICRGTLHVTPRSAEVRCQTP